MPSKRRNGGCLIITSQTAQVQANMFNTIHKLKHLTGIQFFFSVLLFFIYLFIFICFHKDLYIYSRNKALTCHFIYTHDELQSKPTTTL